MMMDAFGFHAFFIFQVCFQQVFMHHVTLPLRKNSPIKVVPFLSYAFILSDG
jgi:hypothetical protein